MDGWMGGLKRWTDVWKESGGARKEGNKDREGRRKKRQERWERRDEKDGEGRKGKKEKERTGYMS